MHGYKVFNPDFTCKGFKFEIGKKYHHEGDIKICNSGFHFCLNAAHCFSYYSFDPKNIVCEVEGSGKIETHDEDSKVCTSDLEIIRQLTWDEVLKVANQGKENTGHSNSGYSNSGNRNSGNWNSGDRNSGDSNSGYRNSGNRNSGNWNSGDSNWGDSNSGNSNSGYRNSGNWNSGNRNSGDSNSGYRNSGAFCLSNNPKLILFDKLTDINISDWENSEAVQTMNELLETTIWVYASSMTDEEKKANPKYETTDGYLKTKTLKEAWADMWGNLSDKKKKAFTDLPNFNWKSFTEITGIKES